MTAVEWLEKEFKAYLPSIHQKGLQDAFQQAKEMEKQQIIDVYIEGGRKGFNEFADDYEKYYNETFKNS